MLAPRRPVCQRDFLTPAGRNLSIVTIGGAVLLSWPLHPLQDITMPLAQGENGSVVIRVRDNGIGIPPDVVDRVFEMFTQGDRSPSRPNGGLGIGLSLVRGLVEAHGGSVNARSDGIGAGSEIVVRLPAMEAAVPA